MRIAHEHLGIFTAEGFLSIHVYALKSLGSDKQIEVTFFQSDTVAGNVLLMA